MGQCGSVHVRGREVRLLMLGLDAAGKTSILYKLKMNEEVTTIPTVGFNVETVSPCKGLTFTVWDVGGQDKIRALWKYYFNGISGLLYVVDSSDRDRLEESSVELETVLQNDSMKGMPLVVLANKQDMPNAMSAAELTERMGLHRYSDRNEWYVQATCMVTGEGLQEAMDAMGKFLNKKTA